MGPSDCTVEVRDLSKHFGQVQAVSQLSFTARPGRVTGFLGPNGSGKTTTLSMLLGLTRPDSGTATIGGLPYHELPRPGLTVGSALEATFHAGHTARRHLLIQAAAIGVPDSRTDEVLSLVGLAEAANRRIGGFSLGMRQRLALAAAMLADPQVILLDEPINGLDPEGIRWIRGLLRQLAAAGKTVLLSSHLLSEIQQTVDDVVVIRRGRLAFAGTLHELEHRVTGETVLADAADRDGLVAALSRAGATLGEATSTGLRFHGLTAEAVGVAALGAGIPLRHLSEAGGGLEQVFLDLVDERQPPAAPHPGTAAQHPEEGQR
ncbi:ATP-binding cassette domain-containing protein [Leucobacter sp. M11]|nr:ATP-binding cassette domain-containing protein [Leucobacter sp. M11]